MHEVSVVPSPAAVHPSVSSFPANHRITTPRVCTCVCRPASFCAGTELVLKAVCVLSRQLNIPTFVSSRGGAEGERFNELWSRRSTRTDVHVWVLG